MLVSTALRINAGQSSLELLGWDNLARKSHTELTRKWPQVKPKFPLELDKSKWANPNSPSPPATSYTWHIAHKNDKICHIFNDYGRICTERKCYARRVDFAYPFLCRLGPKKRHHYVVINNNISQYCLRVKEQGISASGIESMWKASAFCLKGIEEHIDSLFKRNNAMRNLLNIAFAFLVAAIVFTTLSMVALAVISVFVV